MNAAQRFSCTKCGQCCSRSPEVELSEAAALSDVFVFRLMIRIYSLPQTLSDYVNLQGLADASPAFYQQKRLLNAFSAKTYAAKTWQLGRIVKHNKYLMVSALGLDTKPGVCSALRAGLCGIYERRPLTCRTVPLHYSRAEAIAARNLAEFVQTPGYACDTSETASVVIEENRITDVEMREARGEAIVVAGRDRHWAEAIARKMKPRSAENAELPSLQDVEAAASFGALTTSMSVGWQIAADAGLIHAEKCKTLIESQLAVIDRELGAGACEQEIRQTLTEMRAEYRARLNDAHNTLATSR